MVERLKTLCKEKKTNFKRLEKELGFGNGTLAGASPSMGCGRLKILADYFGVTMEYLLAGVDPIPVSGVLLSSEEQRILEYFKKFNELGKAKIESYMDGLVNNPSFVADVHGEKLA